MDSIAAMTERLEDFEAASAGLTRMLMEYQFGIDELTTKISILQEEFAHLHESSPIEHVNARLKSPQSILAKVRRLGHTPSLETIREVCLDIAGVRVICSFVSDVYGVFDMIAGQSDVHVLRVKDYIATPKENGYRSLHALVELPVHLSDRVVPVVVELQLRTVAMDFWAALEHRIYYKYDEAVPDDLLSELYSAAVASAELDTRMESLHQRVHGNGAP
ncbi:MAG: GTP pyrophosphokinase family protein [Ornithinimicrobium sp.]|uniref:GTP pyrophosphokinase n=1 Tax=Ornithinimicrobium sp. TaxID=1977084 RepID=UPI0026DEEDF7|nr:GTP pyrophosphokinase family protein [Ornithinimicrobium sp.]MDO5740220.1 GTP pyrophosphokinase family protein [Ornithinimicrobium sp.]